MHGEELKIPAMTVAVVKGYTFKHPTASTSTMYYLKVGARVHNNNT